MTRSMTHLSKSVPKRRAPPTLQRRRQPRIWRPPARSAKINPAMTTRSWLNPMQSSLAKASSRRAARQMGHLGSVHDWLHLPQRHPLSPDSCVLRSRTCLHLRPTLTYFIRPHTGDASGNGGCGNRGGSADQGRCSGPARGKGARLAAHRRTDSNRSSAICASWIGRANPRARFSGSRAPWRRASRSGCRQP